ncbi:MAG: MIP/aquaporin family protein [Pseudomonadota bacterium]
MQIELVRRLGAEVAGTAFLLAAVVGSGIMAEKLAGGNVALALLCNTIPTGAILFVIITMFGPISGAHFNPAVTFGFWLRGDIGARDSVAYVAAQIVGGIVGVVAAHIMFEQALLQISTTDRSGIGQWFAEWVATFGLMLTILLVLRAAPAMIPTAVGLYITSAYWFTSSTSFANPAVTIARGFSDTFAGIAPADVPLFIVVQLIGAAAAVATAAQLWPKATAEVVRQPAE